MSINRRRETVVDLYLQGWTQMSIAQNLGIAQSTVSLDLRAIEKQWLASAERDLDLVRERELQKLNRMERECWAAWERSQKPAESAVVSTDGTGQKTQKKVTDQCGDPRYMEQIPEVHHQSPSSPRPGRPDKISPTSPDGEQSLPRACDGRVDAIGRIEREGPGIIDGEYIETQLQETIEADERDGSRNGTPQPPAVVN